MKKNKGFTLIELMVVVAIIGILAAVAVPRFLNFMAQSRRTESKTVLSALYNAEAATFEGLAYGAAQAAASSTGYTDAASAGFTPSSPIKLYTYATGANSITCAPGASGCATPAYDTHINLSFDVGGGTKGTWFNASLCGDPDMDGTGDDQFNVASDGGREPVLCYDDLADAAPASLPLACTNNASGC